MDIVQTLSSFKGFQLAEIEPKFPDLIFEGDYTLSLRIDCPWRILHGNFIVAGNVDYRSKSKHHDLLAEMQEYLIGQSISLISIAEAPKDLHIQLGDHTHIQLFPTSSQHESWRFTWEEKHLSAGLNGEIELGALQTNP